MSEKKEGREALGQQIRISIQRNIEKAEATHKREFFRRRLDIAKLGIAAFERGRYAEAVISFKSYIKILEDWKATPEGGLSPSYFDRQKDTAELLLISGVFWDLAKLYDRTKSHIRYEEFLHYLDKYVIFSRGMSYEPVCAETMRKYINNKKCVHTDEFKSAYRRMVGASDSRCFIATALADVCDPETLPRLRSFRDERLLATRGGTSLVKAYCFVSPPVAHALNRAPAPVRNAAARALDWIARLTRII